MGNTQSKLKRKSDRLKVVKRYITFLAVAPDLEVVRAVINKTLIEVIAAISNAAFNGRQGAVHIPHNLISFFQRHKQNFNYSVDCRKSNLTKPHLILKKSGALPIVVPLLATVLGSLGVEFMLKFLRKNDQ